MAGKFEISKAADGTFSFEFKNEDKIYAASPVFQKEDECKLSLIHISEPTRRS